MPAGPMMRTNSGVVFDIINPTPEMVVWDDVAHHLSLIVRCAGAIPKPFTVAQHSMLVHQILREQKHSDVVCLLGLLHDAEEYVVGDIITPMSIAIDIAIPGARQAIDDFKDRIRRIICEKAGITPAQYDIAMVFVKSADMEAYGIECRDVRGFEAEHAPITSSVRITEIMSFSEAKETFLSGLEHYGVVRNDLVKVA